MFYNIDVLLLVLKSGKSFTSRKKKDLFSLMLQKTSLISSTKKHFQNIRMQKNCDNQIFDENVVQKTDKNKQMLNMNAATSLNGQTLNICSF